MRLLRVLIADEDPLLLSAYRTFLAGEHIELTTTISAEVCRAIFRLQPPDIFIVDPQLPGLNIMELLAVNKDRQQVEGPELIFTVRQEALNDELLARPHLTIMFKPVRPYQVAGIVGQFARSIAEPAACLDG